MTSKLAPSFRRAFARLPARVKKEAREAYPRFQEDPDHPGLQFKKPPPHDDIWSIRISKSYRAIGQMSKDRIVWFFIGTHAEYDKLLERL